MTEPADPLHVIISACSAIDFAAGKVSNDVNAARENATVLRDAKVTSDAAKAYFHIKSAYEALDGARKELYHLKDLFDKVIVPELMENDDIDMLRIPELARSFSRQQKFSASFVDKEEGFKWLRDNGQGDLIVETVNAGTLAAFCRSMIMDEGLEPPADVIRVTTYYGTGMSKYTPKDN